VGGIGYSAAVWSLFNTYKKELADAVIDTCEF
jgi:hypothetical protein